LSIFRVKEYREAIPIPSKFSRQKEAPATRERAGARVKLERYVLQRKCS
jgi:hypothetical protein